MTCSKLDITKKPYFHHNDVLDYLMKPLHSKTNIQLIGFSRNFSNGQTFLISRNREWIINFYTVAHLYRYSLFAQNISRQASCFIMWDHMTFAPPEIYEYAAHQFNIAHGLIIFEQKGDYCDTFVFVTTPENNQINNFYLNQKNLFNQFVNNFQITMQDTMQSLVSHTFTLPNNTTFLGYPSSSLSSRQLECCSLLLKDLSTKEIARELSLSPRTVEIHLNIIKNKFRVKDRKQLIKALSRFM